MILIDDLCNKLCAAANEKSKQIGIDINFAICNENGLPRMYRRYGEALVLSITLVSRKSVHRRCYTAQDKGRGYYRCRGRVPYGDPDKRPQNHIGCQRISLFCNGKIAGGIGVDGGSEQQDCEIAEYVVSSMKN